MTDPGVWVVRAGNNNELASQVKLAAAIGWAQTGDIRQMERGVSFPADSRWS